MPLGLSGSRRLESAPPRVAASPIAIECCTTGKMAIPEATVVFGEVVHIAVTLELLPDGLVATDLLEPLARLGRSDWARLGEIFELRRLPDVAPTAVR